MSCTLEWSSKSWSSHNRSANDVAAWTINEPHHPKGKTVVSTSCCIWCSTISLISAVILNKLPDPLHLLKLPVSLKTWQLSTAKSLFFAKYFHYSRSFQSLRVEGQNSLLLDILYTASAGFLHPSYTLSQHTLSFHFTWTFSLLTACNKTEFHRTNRESGKNATRAQPEMKCKLFYWCPL